MNLAELLPQILSAKVLVVWLLGMVFGVFVGSTPGLTATMAVALIVPIGYALNDPVAALAMIIGVSFTAIFAGDIPATFLRIPGTPASAAATLDGHEMAKRGKGRYALTLDLFCSSIGGIIGVLLLMTIAPQLARFALRFDDFEYFWLAVLGLSLSALVSRGAVLKGVLAAMLGVLLATVGQDIFSVKPRFTLGHEEMTDGFHFIPVMIGLFGLAEVLRNVRDLRPPARRRKLARSVAVIWHFKVQLLGHFGQAVVRRLKEIWRAILKPVALRTIWRHKRTVVQSSVVGTVIGALPGAGADIAAWGAYGLAQKTSKNGDAFGTGCEEGVIAPTSANNAAVAGAWIPALVFGLPGDSVTAIVIGAFTVYGIVPGSNVFLQEGSPVQAILLIALLTQFLLIPAGFIGISLFGTIIRLPRSIVLVGVVVFSVVGAYAIRNSVFDIYIMLAFGLVGFFLEWQKVPLAPLILGLILGGVAETKLRSGLIGSDGDLTPLFTRPICVVLVSLLVLAFVAGPLMKLVGRMSRSRR